MADEQIALRFAGVPFRAVSDPDLAPIDLRVLMVIAAHDGFNKNRKGCYASHKRLAALAQAHYKTVARAIAKLISLGYVEAVQQGNDGRLRVYRVIYTQGDHDAFRGDGRTHAPSTQLRSVTTAVTNQHSKSVTTTVTDHPGDEPQPDGHESCGKPSQSVTGSERSVTNETEIGNQIEPENEPTALKSNRKGSRIYSTESNRIKKGIDRAEARLGEVGITDGFVREPQPPERVEDMAQWLSNALRPERRVRHGPATDADAAIDEAIAARARGEPAAVVRYPEFDTARPSAALLSTAISRRARGG